MKKILIVDDEPMMIKIAERALKDNYETVSAMSGEEALDLIDDADPDLVLSDVKMPQMSGLELLARVRERNLTIPFIFMSAEDDDSAGGSLSEAGATAYITKPIKSEELKVLVEKVFGGSMEEKPLEQKAPDTKEEDKLPGWILYEPLIDVAEGMKNSEDADTYLSSVGIFLEHVDDNVTELNRCIKDGDFDTYTIKAHALKSTSRIIGAMVLSTFAAAMERAGKQGNADFIIGEHEEFIKVYRRYEKLFLQHVEAPGSEPIPEAVLKDMLMALKEYSLSEDYTLTEMAVGALLKYKLPPDVEKMVYEVKKCLLKLDWEQIQDIVKIS